MSSLEHLDKMYLVELCCELNTYIMDENVIILAKHRDTFSIELLEIQNQLTSEHSNAQKPSDTVLDHIDTLCSRIKLKVNTARFVTLEQCIDSLQQLVEKYRFVYPQTNSRHDDVISQKLLTKNISLSDHRLKKGNAASIMRSYNSGYLDADEAAEAIEAIICCQNVLQLNNIERFAISA